MRPSVGNFLNELANHNPAYRLKNAAIRMMVTESELKIKKIANYGRSTITGDESLMRIGVQKRPTNQAEILS